MPRAAGRQWQLIRDHLASRADRDFERAVLPYLEYLLPGIWPTRQRAQHDSAGIDLFTRTETGSEIDVIVQCKGFEVLIAREPQARQIAASIASLRRSQIRARRYILLHNRDSRDAEFRRMTTETVRSLVDDQIVTDDAELWGLTELLDQVALKLAKELASQLRNHSSRLSEDLTRSFFFATETVEPVPVRRGSIAFGKSGVDFHVGKPEMSMLGTVFPAPHDVRWSLLTGPFGIGKSKAALMASINSHRSVVLVRAADLTFQGGFSGKTGLMKSIVRGAGLSTGLADLLGPDSAEGLAAVLLADVLEEPNAPHSLIIDGLDENPLFSQYKFLAYLGNVLGELKCQTILITRREHVEVLTGAFRELYAAAGIRERAGDRTGDRIGRSKRTKPVAVTELQLWSVHEAHRLLNLALRRSSIGAAARSRLAKLRETLGEEREIAALAAHPLFMHMLMDLAISEVDLPASEDQLIQLWTFQKITRDIKSHPDILPAAMDIDQYATQMFKVMTQVAKRMLEREKSEEGRSSSFDTIDENALEGLARAEFLRPPTIAQIVLSSLLVPTGPRVQGRPESLEVRFFHPRIRQYFQERRS